MVLAHGTEVIRVEPSAAAGFGGPGMVLRTAVLGGARLVRWMANARHVLWISGGAFVPEEAYADYLARGRELLAQTGDGQ